MQNGANAEFEYKANKEEYSGNSNSTVGVRVTNEDSLWLISVNWLLPRIDLQCEFRSKPLEFTLNRQKSVLPTSCKSRTGAGERNYWFSRSFRQLSPKLNWRNRDNMMRCRIIFTLTVYINFSVMNDDIDGLVTHYYFILRALSRAARAAQRQLYRSRSRSRRRH